jgi:hypothetical protein
VLRLCTRSPSTLLPPVEWRGIGVRPSLFLVDNKALVDGGRVVVRLTFQTADMYDSDQALSHAAPASIRLTHGIWRSPAMVADFPSRCAAILSACPSEAVAGLPEPAVNEPIWTAEHEWLAEPDLHYRHARLAIEYNGADHAHARRMRRDITRELDVEDHRWRVQVVGPAEVFGRPDQVASRVRRLLDERDPGWRARGPFLPFPSQ